MIQSDDSISEDRRDALRYALAIGSGAAAASAMLAPQQLGRMLRTRTDRIYLRSWR